MLKGNYKVIYFVTNHQINRKPIQFAKNISVLAGNNDLYSLKKSLIGNIRKV
jgi:hypothetical protein